MEEGEVLVERAFRGPMGAEESADSVLGRACRLAVLRDEDAYEFLAVG